MVPVAQRAPRSLSCLYQHLDHLYPRVRDLSGLPPLLLFFFFFLLPLPFSTCVLPLHFLFHRLVHKECCFSNEFICLI